MPSLSDGAKQILTENDMGAWTKPAPKLYPHQWNWDSAFVALALARFNRPRAKTEIRSLLRGQWRNGMIPHIIYNPDAGDYYPDPHVWQISRSPDSPRDQLTSGITQPPMITIAAHAIARSEPSQDFAREVYPALLRYHRWFYAARDPQNIGLAAIIHPWESGMDNSPRWLEVLDRINLTSRPKYQREDDTLVPAYERPTNRDYDHFVFLMNLARDLNYDPKQITANSPFVIEDVMLNSILYRANESLCQIAKSIGEPVEEIEQWMEAAREAFRQELWEESSSLYYDHDVRGGHSLRENTIASFMPLYAGIPDANQARRVVQNHLLNTAEYAPDFVRTKFRVPTASKTNRYFDPRGYWRGPIWVNTNWFLIQGLARYGYLDLARQIRQDTLALIEQAGFHEYFDPNTGEGYGTDKFSWTAALALELTENDGS